MKDTGFIQDIKDVLDEECNFRELVIILEHIKSILVKNKYSSKVVSINYRKSLDN